MTLNKFFVFHQRRVFTQLFRNFRMRIHKTVHVRQLSPGYIAVAVPIAAFAFEVLAPLVPLFLSHKSIGVFRELLPNSGMLVHVLLKRGMVFDKLLVPDQRRILAQLFRHFWMAVKKPVHIGNLPALGVIVARGWHAARWRAAD